MRKAGRKKLDPKRKTVRVNISLAPDLAEFLREMPNASAWVADRIREAIVQQSIEDNIELLL